MRKTTNVQPHSSEQDDVQEINSLTHEWETAIKAKDINRLLSLMTDDVVFLAPKALPIKGKNGVEEVYRTMFAGFDIEQESRYEEIQVIGSWAFAWGTDSLTFTPAAGGDSVKMKGHCVTILQRQAGGAWKFARGINNMSQESSPSMPQR
ncbi:MAG TPA: SgcJ/EcaC family oxidoreductase [Candidatus Acidoferrales bacterium]|nr:SgcJ/EcaC family oxidoreductase [Candidatus Acidoferrales bacterium]